MRAQNRQKSIYPLKDEKDQKPTNPSTYQRGEIKYTYYISLEKIQGSKSNQKQNLLSSIQALIYFMSRIPLPQGYLTFTQLRGQTSR